MTFADRLLRYRGLIRLACSDVLHAQQYDLEAEVMRQELMRDYGPRSLPHSMDLCRPGESAEPCRDRMREANAEALDRACAPGGAVSATVTNILDNPTYLRDGYVVLGLSDVLEVQP
jgi:hypothetical protein